MANRILLAYDGSAAALKAFDFALELLRKNGGELSMLAVIKPSEFAVDFGVQTLIQGSCDVLTSDMERLQRRVHFAGCHSTIAIRIGRPSAEILRMAGDWQADLIVMPQPKRPSLARFIAGASIRQIRARAPCDLHVIDG
jgi:nucleotide-binding universal stress UspA family protein